MGLLNKMDKLVIYGKCYQKPGKLPEFTQAIATAEKITAANRNF